VAKNPWVIHLKQKGVYDEISKLLREARKDYVATNPEKSKINLRREYENLKDEYKAIKNEYPELVKRYPYKHITYDQARIDVLEKIKNRVNAIGNELGEILKLED
jgi:Fe-S oxidoreductase